MQNVALKFPVLYPQTLYRSLIELSIKMALMNRYAIKEIGNDFMLRLLKLVPFGSVPIYLLFTFISKTTFDHNGKPARTHSFDTGAAWENLALQGTLRGFVVHGMQGFDYERARTELEIPDEYQVEAMVAVGKPGEPGSLPEKLQAIESPNDRRPLEQTICEGPFRL